MRNTPRIILYLDVARGFGRGMLSGIARYSTLNGPWTFYRKAPTYLKSGPDINLQEIKDWDPDGIICSIAHAQELESLKIPIIGYDPGTYDGPIPCVVADHAETGRRAARHLLDLGHRNFAFCGFNSLNWSRERCRAFCAVIEEAGASVDMYNGPSKTTSWSKEESLIKEWIHSLPKPIGLFCVNDDRAASIIETCRALEFGVPEDISILGADNDEYICDLENPPLTSVKISSDQAGYEAAALLHKMMQGSEKMEGQRIIAYATGITARQSTDILMVQKEEVRKALRFIRENINKPIRVSDVVAAAGLSHRSLNDRFHNELGTSIGKQLTRARIDYIIRLLTDTDMRIQEIASTVGYDDDRHFSRYFKRATGITPQAYRRKILPP
jgi:LacI family transcriptional regulator